MDMFTIGPEADYDFDTENKNNESSLLDEIRSLKAKKKVKVIEEEPVSLLDVKKDIKSKKKKKKETKAKKQSEKSKKKVESEDGIKLLDVESFIVENFTEEDIDKKIVDTQKRGYDKLKRSKNEYKKEFSEELTLLYNLLSELDTFGKELEKDLKATRGTKVRGINKYSNDLAELVLGSKQSKLNTLKEIAAVKKTIADLKLKAEAAEAKEKKNNGDENNTEFLASAYLKNILNYGRNDFVNTMVGGTPSKESFSQAFNDSDDRGMYVPDEDDDRYFSELESRLEYDENPFRSEEANKYIEYENRGVQIYIKKCIDTGEWEFIALDKTKQQIYDYPVPRKRDVGKVKFSDDGTYGTDSRGRMYKVIDYLSPDETEGYDD